MTMPTLMAQHRKQVVETKLAKFYSTINQAVALTNSEFGEPENWVKDCGSYNSPTCTTDETIEWFKQYIGKHLQYTKIEKSEDDNEFYIYFADGSIFRITNYISDMLFYENEKAKNNKRVGLNSFAFRFNPVVLPHQNANTLKYAIKPTIEPYTVYWNGTREDLFVSTGVSGFGCSSNGGNFCTKLIQMNGWKIPKDYPLKF